MGNLSFGGLVEKWGNMYSLKQDGRHSKRLKPLVERRDTERNESADNYLTLL
jgi:hypothetical protein